MEYLRPWKLVTLLIGTLLLIIGALYYKLPDWDIPLSIIMALLTYLFAPKCVEEFTHGKTITGIVGAGALWIITVDSSYMIYNIAMDNPTVREENFLVSSCLFFMCGIVWNINMSMKEIVEHTRNAVKTINIPHR